MTRTFLSRNNRRLTGALLLLGLAGAAVLPAQAGSRIVYVPAINLVPEVLQPDGQTPRTYNTDKGPSLWVNDLPVLQGDKVKVDVFVATGGAELQKAVVRLDNKKIADLDAAHVAPGSPWNTVIDTARLSTGYHMIEVWAESGGDRPQSSTRFLTFNVAKEVVTAVKGSLQSTLGGVTTTLDPGSEAPESNTPPDMPDFLKGKAVDANAQVVVRADRANVDAALKSGTVPVPITDRTLLRVEAASGNATATQFAYALVRNGVVINATGRPLPLSSPAVRYYIRLQKRTDTEPGLRAGPLSLWVWGIDAAGNPSPPVKTPLSIL